ncbi:transporter substrate-binding domain-containing protein [Calditrichota bacterium]
MFKRKNLFVLIVFISAVSTFLFAQEKSAINRILKAKEIRVGTTGKQPPFTAKAKDGKLMGYEIELTKILADAMKVKLTFVEKPFAELLPALEKGELDAIMSGMTITPERNLRVAFAGPYIVSGKSILAKAKRISDLDEMGEINRPVIKAVVLEGTTSQKYVENFAPNVKLTTVSDYESGVELVLTNKVDVMVADYPICVISILRHPDEGLATLEEPLTIEPIGMALPANDFLLHNMIRNYLNALNMVGVLADLEKKWFDDGSWLIRLP